MTEMNVTQNGVIFDKPHWLYKPRRGLLTTVYPDGTSDYSVHTDARGVVTISKSYSYENRSEYETQVFHPTNQVTPITTDRSISYHDGASITEREWADQWTHNTRLTEYNASGCMFDTHVTESSDASTVTNSVTVYDFLGRTVSSVTPLGVTSNHYDAVSTRILMSTRTGQPPTYNLYNELGQQVGTVVSGITNRTDVCYETISGEVWRVSESLAGMAHTVTREQQTGLSDALRRHTVMIGANGVTNAVTAVWNEATQTLTETQASSLRATPVTRTSKYGRTISETSVDGGRNFFFDPYGRVFYTERKPSGSASWLSETWLGFNDFGDVEKHGTFIAGGNTVAMALSAFDAFGRTLTSTDPLGNTVTHTTDALGQRIGDGKLEAGADIGDIFIRQWRDGRRRLPHRRLQARKGKIRPCLALQRPGEGKAPCISGGSRRFHGGTAGIGQAEQLGGLVEGFAERIVDGGRPALIVSRPAHQQHLGVAA